MSNILIIDDDRNLCDMLNRTINRMGHETVCTHTLRDGLQRALSEAFDVVLLDVNLPDGDGIKMLPRIRETKSSPEVIIITGSGDPYGAELAIKSGAWDYIEKASSPKAMILPLIRALDYRGEKRSRKAPVVLNRMGILGESPKIRACLDFLAQAAHTEVNVLITGETGTGKELFARAIHMNSPRADKAFVIVDCSALPETLAESLLFGYEQGAFTGAVKAKQGLIKEADGGTLFLDEIGELSLPVQKVFLRVLQERQFRPIGAKKEVTSNFRLVAATNRDLDQMVQSKEFREELLFRLRSFILYLPPLRERIEDIKGLTLHHMTYLCERYHIPTKGFSSDFFDTLAAYKWPGNVRELVNTLERVIAVAHDDPVIFPAHLPVHLRVHVARSQMDGDHREVDVLQTETASSDPLPPFHDFRKELIEKGEKQYFAELVSLAQGNIEEACRISNLSRSRLYAFLQKHGISLRAGVSKISG